ncbi:MAG: DUF5357 family protein [Cyanobacteria bacterium J06621_11]
MQDIFQDINKQARELLVPKAYFSWQTLLLLSAFSLFIAGALEYIEGPEFVAIRILTTLSWIFFTVAVWWWLSQIKNLKVYEFPIYPWIVGVVLCCFLFRPWRDEERLRLALSSWPMISVGVMALPWFVSWDLKLKKLDDLAKKSLITTTLVNLLLSSWIIFHFMIQSWALNYPSLLLNGVGDSFFIYDFAVERDQPSQGGVLLERMADDIEKELTDQPWYQAERWLYTRAPRLETIFEDSLNSLDAPNEDVFWQLDVAEPRQVDEAYWLDLRANWTGPTARGSEFYLEKGCKIFPVNTPRPVAREDNEPQPTTKVARVDCGEDVPTEKFLKPISERSAG